MTDTQFLYVTYIASTAEKVWKAITDADISGKYWGNSNVSDWTAGSPWKHVGGTSKKTLVIGEVVESAPPKRLVVTWAAPPEAANKAMHSRVTFAIEPVGEMVRLTVTHDRLKVGSEMAGSITEGWPRVLSSLKSYLETGRPLDVWAGMKAA
jgi:uncharacterized protein YndB with AHSA1/START domain